MKWDRSPAFTAVLKAARGPSKLAKALGITPQSISGWSEVPLHHLNAVSAFTGIPKEKIRPDHFRKTHHQPEGNL